MSLLSAGRLNTIGWWETFVAVKWSCFDAYISMSQRDPARHSPRRLPTFGHQGKTWTVDERLGEFRFIVYGEVPEFVRFESEQGVELWNVFLSK